MYFFNFSLCVEGDAVLIVVGIVRGFASSSVVAGGPRF